MGFVRSPRTRRQGVFQLDYILHCSLKFSLSLLALSIDSTLLRVGDDWGEPGTERGVSDTLLGQMGLRGAAERPSLQTRTWFRQLRGLR